MQEWFNWHAWKACVPLKGTGGSNPPLSADIIRFSFCWLPLCNDMIPIRIE
jgi:hypothetical protein